MILGVVSTLRLFRCNLDMLDALDDVTGDVRGDVTGDVKGDVTVEGDGLTIPRLAFDACVGLANEALDFLSRVGLFSFVELSVTAVSPLPFAFSGVDFWAKIEFILVDIGTGLCFPSPAIVSAMLCLKARRISGSGLRPVRQ
jgi:hypothetical protein